MEFFTRASEHKLPPWMNFTTELAAWQVEIVVGICSSADEIIRLITEAWQIANCIASKMGCRLELREVVEIPEDWQFEDFVVPDGGYYEDLARKMGLQRAKAAASVSGTHLNLGTRDDLHSVLASDRLLSTGGGQLLMRVGDFSHGRRLELYSVVVPKAIPPHYGTVECFLHRAMAEGFSKDRSVCVDLWRIRKGYLELRMLGVPSTFEEFLEELALWFAYSERYIYSV